MLLYPCCQNLVNTAQMIDAKGRKQNDGKYEHPSLHLVDKNPRVKIIANPEVVNSICMTVPPIRWIGYADQAFSGGAMEQIYVVGAALLSAKHLVMHL